MYQALFFFLPEPKKQRSKKKPTKIVTADLRLERDAPELPGTVIVLTSLYASTPYVS